MRDHYWQLSPMEQEGVGAFRRGISQDANPHSGNNKAEWHRGWDWGKRAASRLNSQGGPPLGQQSTGKSPQRQTI